MFLQNPLLQVNPVGHWELVVHTLLHEGTGDGEGVIVGVGDGVGDGDAVGVAVAQIQFVCVEH